MTKTGAKTAGGFDIYTWHWKPEAQAVGRRFNQEMTGFDIGVNADEVEQARPDLIHYMGGYKAVDYRGV